MNVYAEVARWVQFATRPFHPVAAVGLVAGAVVVLALVPWTLHSTATVILLLAVAALAVAGPLRLVRHRRRLLRTLGDEPKLRAELSSLHGQAKETIDGLVALDRRRRDVTEGRVGAGRGMVASLNDLRALRQVLDLNQAADQVRDLYLPVSPAALVLSGIAAVAVLGLTVLAPVVALISVIGLLLR